MRGLHDEAMHTFCPIRDALRRIAFSCLALLPLTLAASCATGDDGFEVYGEVVTYTAADGTTCQGYMAWDPRIDTPRPGVLIVHEWWGHNDYVRGRALQLAAMGYTALALDMYGGGRNTGHPDEAGEFMNAVFANMGAGEARFRAARELLEAHETTDPEKTAAIGYCFGGAVVLHMARTGSDLDGVASFHGALGAQQRTTPDQVNAEVLICHGGADEMIPPADVEATKAEFGDKLEFHQYAGAKHGFTNPAADAKGAEFGLPLAYDAEADRKSWAELDAFLVRIFR